MVEEPIAFLRAGDRPATRTEYWGEVISAAEVCFERREFDQLFRMYGRMVAAGEWRDYALDFLSDRAVFSVFRRSSDRPIYLVEKRPALRARQGQYAVLAASGHVLKRGRDLAQVLRLFDRKLIKALGEA